MRTKVKALFWTLLLASGLFNVKAKDLTKIYLTDNKSLIVKVNLNNYAGKPITDVQVFLEVKGNGDYRIVPISNPNAKEGQVGITDQEGTAFFQIISPQPGTITLIARAVEIPKKPPLLIRFMKRTWHIFMKPEKAKQETLDLYGMVEYTFEFV